MARTASVLTHRYRDGRLTRAPDQLVVEEPMAIHLDDTLVTTTMRTPGHDFELATGFCFTDGLLAGAEVVGCRYCSPGGNGASAADLDFNVVTVDTGGQAPVPEPRLVPTSSSCGLCGSASLDELCDRLSPIESGEPFPLDVLAGIPERVGARQELFGVTGAVHAAAAVDRDGEPVLVREDIGRHNAVDKVVGHFVLGGAVLPASHLALWVSGRASFEMVQKAWAAGFAALVAVSAPSALAVDTARAAGITLAGFARDGRMNLYAPEELPTGLGV